MTETARSSSASDPAERWILPAGTELPPCPPADMDPYLDAAAECFLRFGVRKTSVQDIAANLDVNRTTVYRQVGNVESIVRLLTAREVHRHLSAAYQRTSVEELTPEGLVRLLAEMIRIVSDHPIVAKVLRDERDLVGGAVQTSTGVFSRIATLITPALAVAMASGQIADRDPAVVAEWLARVSATAVLSPPPGDLERFLAELLVPALTPTG
jgi:AcrR family transcriptional regulator